ncbi:MAG: hypothetical protein KDA68_12400 [Planctomycetaceae bacterium]|nr:hypothetical protein [Planctomycetaceae bacterium]
MHNVSSLICELEDISKRWKDENRLESHIEKIQQELEQALLEEDDILCKLPEYRSRVQQLARAKSPAGIYTGCRILSDDRELYEKILIDTASECISRLPKEKKNAHKSIRRIATLAFQHGKEDNDVWEPFTANHKREATDLFDEIIELSISGRRQYECVFCVTGPPSEIQSTLRKTGFKPLAKAKLPTQYLEQFRAIEHQSMFVNITLEALSIRSAVSTCRKQLAIAIGLVDLYQSPQSLQVHPATLVRTASGQEVHFLQSEQAFRRLHPRSNPHQDIREGLDLLRNSKRGDDRLLGAMELLSMASATSDSRVRFINLWSSIETLAGGHEGKTTLERVSSLLIPLIISRHVGRTNRYLAIETQKLGDFLKDFGYGVGFSQSSNSFVSPQDMMMTLASQRGSQGICDLLKFARHPLLRFRIYLAWETFHDPKRFLTMLDHSKKRLEWQLGRIYRARNLLIHQGEESPFLVPLLDNLQNYLSMAIQRLIHELKQHPKWDVRHAIEYWNGKMSYLHGSLERCPEVLTVADFVDGGSNKKLWGQVDSN